MKRFMIMVALLGGLATTAPAADYIAQVGEVHGKIKLARQGQEIDSQAADQRLQSGDILATAADSKATIFYTDGTRVRVFESSQVTVEQQQGSLGLKLAKGGVWTHKIPGRNHRFHLRSAAAVVGVKGTKLAMTHEPGGASGVAVFNGEVGINNGKEQIALGTGKMIASVQKGKVIKDQIKDIPLELRIKPDKWVVDLAKGGRVQLTIQVVSRFTHSPQAKQGMVYLAIPSGMVDFPRRVALDAKGQGTAVLEVKPGMLQGETGAELPIAAVMEESLEISSGEIAINLLDTGAANRRFERLKSFK